MHSCFEIRCAYVLVFLVFCTYPWAMSSHLELIPIIHVIPPARSSASRHVLGGEWSFEFILFPYPLLHLYLHPPLISSHKHIKISQPRLCTTFPLLPAKRLSSAHQKWSPSAAKVSCLLEGASAEAPCGVLLWEACLSHPGLAVEAAAA